MFYGDAFMSGSLVLTCFHTYGCFFINVAMCLCEAFVYHFRRSYTRCSRINETKQVLFQTTKRNYFCSCTFENERNNITKLQTRTYEFRLRSKHSGFVLWLESISAWSCICPVAPFVSKQLPCINVLYCLVCQGMIGAGSWL